MNDVVVLRFNGSIFQCWLIIPVRPFVLLCEFHSGSGDIATGQRVLWGGVSRVITPGIEREQRWVGFGCAREVYHSWDLLARAWDDG